MEMQKKETEILDPETEFLACKKETGHEWELFKENVRPLKRGRNVNLLNQALKSQIDSNLKNSLLQHRRNLIQAIDQYRGTDPLHPWLQCIKWVQESFPPGGDCSGLIVIYEQCVRTFWHDHRYKDDLRYLKVWLEYAENCNDAQLIYSFLEANKIGLTHSSFYISYALHLESKNKIKTANHIFNTGISVNAQPIEKLKASYKKFLNRSMRRPTVTEEDPTESQYPFRSFGTILGNREPRNQTTEGSIFPKKKLKTDRAPGNSLSVYKDTVTDMRFGNQSEMSKLGSNSWHNLAVRAERNKENNAIPSKWTSNKVHPRFGQRVGGTTAATPCLEIFVDDECAEESVRGHDVDNETRRSPSTLQLRDRDVKDIKKETELLRENPLRNFPAGSLPR